jgi:FixJ family two-component response regulator
MTDKRTVCVVDDDPGVLKAVARLLGTAGFDVRRFVSAQAFLDGPHEEPPGCAVVDVAMPELSGLDLQEVLTRSAIDCPIIFITAYADVPTSVRAMKAGAADFLTKPVDEFVLIQAVDAALQRSAKNRVERSEVALLKERWSSLTPREREVFEHAVAGMLNKQIAAHLGTVEKTVKVHRARVMHKMGADSFAELVRMSERLRENGTNS